MPNIRPAAVDSIFYPGNPQQLSNMIQSYFTSINLDENEISSQAGISKLKGLIVPHAGYVYSGETAARAYKLLNKTGKKFKRVLLLGPAHRVWLAGAATCTSEFFQTPLGDIPIDLETLIKLQSKFSWFSSRDDAHAQEHSLEVQLPFLQETMSEFELLPIVVGNVSAESLAEMLSFMNEDEQTLTIISTDLSHFHDYETAQTIDEKTANLIEKLDYQKLTPDGACGADALRGALLNAARNNWQVHRLGLCNSGDTAGDKNRVVGYGAWALMSA